MMSRLMLAKLWAGAVGSLSEIWGELQRAAGATERMVELLQSQDAVTDRDAPLALAAPVRGRLTFSEVTFRYPARISAPVDTPIDMIREGLARNAIRMSDSGDLRSVL